MAQWDVFPGAAGLAAFHDVVSQSLVPQRIDPAPGPFQARLRAQQVADVGVVEVTTTPLVSRRRSGSGEDDGSCFLLVATTGSGELTHRHGTEQVAPGRAVLLRRGADFEVRYPRAARLLFLAVGADRVPGPRAGVRPVELTRPARAMVGALPHLAEAALAADASAGRGVDDDAHRLLDGAVDMVLHPATRSEPLRVAAPRLMEAHLDDPLLDVSRLASMLGVSVRTLHRAYSGTGTTVAGEIRARRVRRADEWVTSRPDLTLTDIAHRAGFGSASAFSAAYRDETGRSPSSVRVAARDDT